MIVYFLRGSTRDSRVAQAVLHLASEEILQTSQRTTLPLPEQVYLGNPPRSNPVCLAHLAQAQTPAAGCLGTQLHQRRAVGYLVLLPPNLRIRLRISRLVACLARLRLLQTLEGDSLATTRPNPRPVYSGARPLSLLPAVGYLAQSQLGQRLRFSASPQGQLRLVLASHRSLTHSPSPL